VTRLFHLSDVHFGAEDPTALDWFAGLVAAEKPDAVVMTGDLTMRARPSEFRRGGDWLRGLGVPVTVEVGNHDIPYYYDPLRRFFRPYRRYLSVEKLIERPLDLPGVAIVPLKTTARAQFRLDWSKGNVSDHALAETLRLIASVPQGRTILVAAHHPLVQTGPPETAGTRHGGAALDALATAGVAVVLTGHIHEPYDVACHRGGHSIRLIGAGTISRRVRHSPASFNELRINRGEIVTIVRTMNAASGIMPPAAAA
jgi:3',5'-cyclic AMP phosphodiesterase CpdA